MKKSTLHIKAGDHSIYIGNDVFTELKQFLNANYKSGNYFILVDENTRKYCLPDLLAHVKVLDGAEVIELHSGEEDKNIASCMQVWKALGQNGADRKTLMINLGGGVISDLGGFAASVFKRGIDFINVPTTLLAQVDASVGGKTGIDFGNLKNEIGLFNDPKAVFIYPCYLNSLSERQLLSGFAEIIKHSLICDRVYWEKLKLADVTDASTLSGLIAHSVEIKNNIVTQDPKEQGLRKTLNFGHTVGHAIESYFLERANTLLHGEAVAIGMICESYLSYKKVKLNHAELDEITEFIFSMFKTVALEQFDEHRLIELMRHDKKNLKGEINFTLISKIGLAETDKTCTIDLIKESFRYYREQVNIRKV